MKKLSLLIAAIIVVLIIPLLLSQPSFNGSTPGCSGSGCHTFQDGIVSVAALSNLQVEVTVSGTTSKVAGELVDQNGVVVNFINSTNNNPFILTAPSAGTYTVNAGFKNPSRKWDSSMVVLTDLQPPAAPSNLTAIVNQNPLSVQLNWIDNSDVEDGFVIERETATADVYEVIGTVGPNVTMYIDTNVSYFTYNYRVKAFNAAGDSPYSNIAQILVPVELTSFTANVNNNGQVVLNWTTATELNNQMFEIQRSSDNEQFATIGYVDGQGTTTEPQEYSYIDRTVETGTYYYRLKQIDFGGRYEYSSVIEAEVNGPLKYNLEQNYPNPFNPATIIKYNIANTGYVKLAVYNLAGEQISILVAGIVEAGFYEITFDASGLPSGIYLYRLDADNFSFTRKMTLIK